MSWVPLVGHENVLLQFAAARSRGRLGHAFLFVGPDGIGKKRTARHLAQALLCEFGGDGSNAPCGHCAGCVQVESLVHPDYFELTRPEDKNVLPIDAIVDLCSKLSLKAARGRHKIAVVDDADYLNDEAANAFLKTLEEPPPGSLLILIATGVESQLETIVSRCQVVRFSELSTDQVAGLLIALGEATDRTAAQQMAEWGAGSIGRAIALAGGDWSAIREQLLTALSSAAVPCVELATEIHQFIEDAGKEAAVKRGRAREVIRLAADFYRLALRRKVGAPVALGPKDLARLDALVSRVDDDTIEDLIGRCLDADFHLARFLNQNLAVRCWIDDLAQITAGLVVESIGTA